MNMMKIALLGTAALAAVSVSARADNLSDLKAQIEALNARVAAVETAPAVPAGFSLMTVGKADAIVIPGLEPDRDYGKTATQIGIMPTADVAAPASTVIQWSGFVRAALVYTDGYVSRPPRGKDIQTFDVLSRAEIKVVGKTDTAVGEVGASVKLRAQFGSAGVFNRTGTTPFFNGFAGGKPNFQMPGAWGWWKMTPELTLAGGVDGSLAGIGYGYDGACNCYYTDNASAGYGHAGDPAQMRLSYASGPISAAIAVEDYLNDLTPVTGGSSLGVAGEVKYSGDTISGEVSAGYWAAPIAGPEDAWQIAAGLGFALGDMAKISAAAGIGSGHLIADDYWKASILGSINLSEVAHAEVGYNHVDNEGALRNQDAVLAGIYYDPVSQLTIGLEGEWIHDEDLPGDTTDNKSITADLVTVFRF
jgi:opacity protein-like surface antigen